jgi:lysophospholipase L1-like esterase
MRKTVLCFGDSNTWGWIPGKVCERFDETVRWPAVMAKALGDEYYVIEMGQNGRTTVWDDPVEQEKNGFQHIIPILECCYPVDLVIIMLGTNDCKERFGVNGYNIAVGAGNVARKVKQTAWGRNGASPEVLLVCPAPIGDAYETEPVMGPVFGKGAAEKSREVANYLEGIAKQNGCHYMDAGKIVTGSPKDGVHLEAEEHAKLARAIFDRVKEIIG